MQLHPNDYDRTHREGYQARFRLKGAAWGDWGDLRLENPNYDTDNMTQFIANTRITKMSFTIADDLEIEIIRTTEERARHA